MRRLAELSLDRLTAFQPGFVALEAARLVGAGVAVAGDDLTAAQKRFVPSLPAQGFSADTHRIASVSPLHLKTDSLLTPTFRAT